MIKVTRTKSRMTIVTIKAFGFYANVSFGKQARKPAPKPTPAPELVWWPYGWTKEGFQRHMDFVAFHDIGNDLREWA